MTSSATEPEAGRTWWIVGLIGVSAWCLYLYLFGPKRPGVLEGTALSQPAEYDWTLHDLDGRPVEFAKYRGKTVFLNIWATWCGPCVSELPSIVNLARSPRLEKVAFVCVSIDESPDTVRQFLTGKHWPMTVLHAGSAGLPAVFATDGIPATFLIAPDGKVAASTVGSAAWDDPAVVAFLERLASAKPAPGPGSPPEEIKAAPARPAARP